MKSEGVLRSSLKAVSVLVVSGHAAEFSVDTELFGSSDRCTDLAGQLNFGAVVGEEIVAIHRDEARSALDVPAEDTAFTFVTYVEVGGRCLVVAAQETCIGLHVDIRTSNSG